MSGVINETYAGGSVTARTRTSYDYDQRSFRIRSATENDGTPTINDNLWDANASRRTANCSVVTVVSVANKEGGPQRSHRAQRDCCGHGERAADLIESQS
jgi:hypothetical protein